MTDRTEVDARLHRMGEAELRPTPGFIADAERRADEAAKLAAVPLPPPPVLIALTSPAMGAGKSEVARRLCERHGFKATKFALVLKAMTRSFLLHGLALPDIIIEQMIEGRLKEEPIDGLGVSPRHLMQTLGTEWGRGCVREDLWVHLTSLRVRAQLAMNRSVVIDDLRYPNELDAVIAMGGVAVRVTRPGVADATGHCSEGALAHIPMDTLPNSGTLEDLHALTDGLVKIVRARVAARDSHKG